MGDNKKQSGGGDGIDLLSKLFEDELGKTEVAHSPLDGNPFGGSTKVDEPGGVSDKTELLSKQKLDNAFNVPTSELDKNGRTEVLSKSENPFAPASVTGEDTGIEVDEGTEFANNAQNPFDSVLQDQPISDSKISFFDVKPEAPASAEPAEAAGGSEDPIEAALKEFGTDDIPPPKGSSAPVSDEEPILDLSSVGGSGEEASAPQGAAGGEFQQKSEVKPEDFADVFASDPIQVSEVQVKKAKLSAALKKFIAAGVAAGLILGCLGFSFVKLRSDEGLFGYRMEGLGFAKAYQQPDEEALQSFEIVFKASNEALAKDDPVAIKAAFEQLKTILLRDERNAEALSRLLDHSAALISWYGTASDWSAQYDQVQKLIDEVSQKSKAYLDTLIIERAKARRSLVLGDFAAAKTAMETALGRFNISDDLSFLLIAQASLHSGDLAGAKDRLSKVSDKNMRLFKFWNASLADDRTGLEALAAEGYLPAKVRSLSMDNTSPKLQRLERAEKLKDEIKDYPYLSLQLRDLLGDLYAESDQADKARIEWKAIVALLPKNVGVWLKLAKSYESDAQWDEALAAYQGIEKAGSLSEASYYRYAELLRIRGKLLDASTLAKKGLELFPKSASLHNQTGLISLDLYQIDPAKESFNKALEIDPNFEPATLGLVTIAMQRKEYAEASALLKRIKPESKSYPSALVSLAKIELIKGSIKEAETLFLKALKADPTLDLVYPQVVELQLQQERDEEAIALVEDGMKSLSKSPLLRMSKAKILQFQRKPEEALEVLKPVEKTYDHLLSLQLLKADLLIDNKNYREAAAVLTEFVNKDVRNMELNYLRAKLFYQDAGGQSRDLSSGDIAMKVLDASIRQNPDAERYRVLMARLAMRLQDRSTAQEQIDYVLRVNPKNAEALSVQGDFHMEAGNYELASKSYKQALNLTKRRSDLYGRLAEAFKQLNRSDLAIQYYQKVTAERGRDAEAWLELGKLYNQEGRFQGALAALKKSVAINPKLSEAYYFLGFIQKELGDRAGALRSFEAFLALEPTSTESATIKDEVYFLKNGGSSN